MQTAPTPNNSNDAELPNGCQACADHDQETRKLLGSLFGPDEIVMLVTLVSATMKFNAEQMKREKDLKIRMLCRATMDFAGAITGKLLIGLDPASREGLIRQIETLQKVTLSMKHAPCPHEDRTGDVDAHPGN